MIAIELTDGLLNSRLVAVNQDYVIIRGKTKKVIIANDPKRLGEKYELTIPPATRGSGTIPPPPLPMLVALWTAPQQSGWFSHETIKGTFPGGASVTTDVIPPEDWVWYKWAMTFGDLVDQNVVIIHSHATMMKDHEDPLLLSIVDHVYPLNLKVTPATPHRVTIENRGTEARYIEATFWLVEVKSYIAEEIDRMFAGLRSILLQPPVVVPPPAPPPERPVPIPFLR